MIRSFVYRNFRRNHMDKRTTGIVAYISVIGLVLALAIGDKEGAKFHINQALVILLFNFLVFVPYVGRAWGVFMLACWVMGIVTAARDEEKPVPIIGTIQLLK